MPPETTHRQHEKPLKERVEKPQHNAASDQYDTAGRPLLPHELDSTSRQEVEEALEAPQAELANELVTTKIEITGDINGEWDRVIDELVKRAEKANALEKNSNNERVARKQIRQLRLELEAVAKIKARHEILTQISDGREPSVILEQVTQSRKLHADRLGTNTDTRARIEGAAMLILRKTEQRIAKDIATNPDKLSELQKENKELFDNVLRHSGAEGGTHEVSFTPSKKTSLAEQKVIDFDKRITNVEKHIQKLSWFARKFSKEGKVLRARLDEMKTERRSLAFAAATELIGKALSTKEAKQALSMEELSESNMESVETTWEEYQAELASMHSLQEKRAALSRLPWKDRAEKKKLDMLMLVKDERIKALKAAHAAEIREKNLARERELQEYINKSNQ